MRGPDVVIQINGARYTGWTEITINRALDQFPDSFSLVTADIGPLHQIAALDRVQILSRGQVILTGEIEQVIASASPTTGYVAQFAGRSIPYHLAKSHAEPAVYRNQTPVAIAAAMGRPWAIPVASVGFTPKSVPRVRVRAGDTGWQHLDEIAAQQAAVWVCTPAGGLSLVRPGDTRTDTVIGPPNTKEFRLSVDVSSRYTQIRVRGQTTHDAISWGTDAQSTVTANGGIAGGDVLYLTARLPSGAGACRDLGVYESAARLGKSVIVTATLSQWHTAEGATWQPGMLCPVRADWLGIDTQMIVQSVTLTHSAAGGTSATLSLCPVETYTPKPPPPKRTGKPKKTNKIIDVWTEINE